MKAFIRLALAAAVGTAVWKAIESMRQSHRSGHPAAARQSQTTREGASVVDEWGEESFPASDPPQSW